MLDAADTAKPTHRESVQNVSQQLRRLRDGVGKANLKSDIKTHLDHLDMWTARYLQGVDAAQKINETAADTLHEAQAELALVLDEYTRLENEGGNPLTPEQERLTGELTKALSRIHKLIPAVESTFTDSVSGAGDPPNPETEPQGEPEIDPESPPEGNPNLNPPPPPVSNPEV